MLNSSTLMGQVDIVSRIYDIVGLPQWRLSPHRIDYWIDGATQSVPGTNTVMFAGQIPPEKTVTVIYRRQSPLVTQGDYDNRICHVHITNTDGDTDFFWDTGAFDLDDYWVTVRAENVAGNVSSESIFCTIAEVVNPDIHLPETSHDFGRLPLMWTATWNLMEMNLGSDYLSIGDVAWTNGASSVDREHFFVPPDSVRVEVEVSFTPTTVGKHVGSLEIATNASDESIVVVVLQEEGLAPESVEDLGNMVAFGVRGTRALSHGVLELSYTLDRPGTVEIMLFDAAGRRGEEDA